MPPITTDPQVIPYGKHINIKVLDFLASGAPDLTEALQIGGTSTGLTVKVGNLLDNDLPEGPTNPFTEDPADGRIVRMGASSISAQSGALNIIAPGTPGPGLENVIQVPYSTLAQPSQEHVAVGSITGPFDGI